MIGRILRLAIVPCIVAALLLLFFYAFVAAVIIAPIVAVLFFLFGRRVETRFWTVKTGSSGTWDPGRERRPGPVIDHDPDALAHKPPEE